MLPQPVIEYFSETNPVKFGLVVVGGGVLEVSVVGWGGLVVRSH